MTAPSAADLAAEALEAAAAVLDSERTVTAVRALLARCQELEREVELANFDGHYDRAVAAEAERDEARGQATEAENERVEWQNRCAAAEARVAELEQALREIERWCEQYGDGDSTTLRTARAALQSGGNEGGTETWCDGSGDCPATVHIHGCYSDDGSNCDHPGEHAAQSGGSDSR